MVQWSWASLARDTVPCVCVLACWLPIHPTASDRSIGRTFAVTLVKGEGLSLSRRWSIPGAKFPARAALQRTVECSDAVRRVKNCSQIEHLRTSRPTTRNTLPIWSARMGATPRRVVSSAVMSICRSPMGHEGISSSPACLGGTRLRNDSQISKLSWRWHGPFITTT